MKVNKELITFEYFFEDNSISMEHFILDNKNNVAELINKQFSPEFDKLAILLNDGKNIFIEFNPRIKKYIKESLCITLENELDMTAIKVFEVLSVLRGIFEESKWIKTDYNSLKNYKRVFELSSKECILMSFKNELLDSYQIVNLSLFEEIFVNSKIKIMPKLLHKCENKEQLLKHFS